MNIENMIGRLNEDQTTEVLKECLENLREEVAVEVIKEFIKEHNLREEFLDFFATEDE